MEVQQMSEKQRARARALHPRRNLRYMEQDCDMTLAEGLKEYYTQIDNLITEDNTSPEVAKLFHYHDTVHVLFGCDTSIGGETLADTWSIAGTDVTLRGYMEYLKLDEVKELLNGLSTWEAFWLMARSLPLMPKAWWRARKMSKKWPFRDNEQYANVPLSHLRREFNINVIHLDK